MLTRRSLLRRAVGALAAGTLAGVSRWLPAPKAEDWFVLDESIPIVADRWPNPPSYVNSLANLLDKELEQLTRDVMNGCGTPW